MANVLPEDYQMQTHNDSLHQISCIAPETAIQQPNGFIPSEYARRSLEAPREPEKALNEDLGNNLPDLSISKVSSKPPLIKALATHIDRATIFGLLPFSKEKIKDVSDSDPQERSRPQLLRTTGYKVLRFGDFRAVRQPYKIGVCRYVFWLYHINHSDPILTIKCKPLKGNIRRAWFDLAPRMGYVDNGIDLALEGLKAIGATDTKVTYLEVAGDTPEVPQIIKFIQKSGAIKKNGGRFVIDGNGCRAGKKSSDRCASLYANGKKLKQRGKQYIGEAAKDVLGELPATALWRFEWRLKGNENKRLTYFDGNGERQIIEPHNLTDKDVLLAIFRTQTETGFIFRLPNPDTGKLEPIQFFDWDAIGAKKLSRGPRHLRADSTTYNRRQLISGLEQDSRIDDYLVKTLEINFTSSFTKHLTDPAATDGLIDAIMQDPCNLNENGLREILNAYHSDAAERLAAQTARRLPKQMATIVAKEFNLEYYHKGKIREYANRPAVNRPLSTLKSVA